MNPITIILIIIVVIALNCRSAKEFWSTLGAILGIVTGVVLAAVLLLFILGVMITGLWPWIHEGCASASLSLARPPGSPLTTAALTCTRSPARPPGPKVTSCA